MTETKIAVVTVPLSMEGKSFDDFEAGVKEQYFHYFISRSSEVSDLEWTFFDCDESSYPRPIVVVPASTDDESMEEYRNVFGQTYADFVLIRRGSDVSDLLLAGKIQSLAGFDVMANRSRVDAFFPHAETFDAIRVAAAD